MGHTPSMTIISEFKKSNFPFIWNFLFRLVIRCLTGRNFGLNKAKPRLMQILHGIHYHEPIDFASILWEEFVTHVSH